MIKLKNVTKKYGSTVALDDFSLEIYKGEVCVLLGPSGCGKTTCLKMINRMLEPDSGSIYLNGSDIRSFKPEALRRKIGYVIQNIGLFPHMSVAENIGLVPKILSWDKKRIAERIHEMVHLVGLDPTIYLDKYPYELSGGEAQRIGVARALAADPEILIMDEPFGAVDPLNKEKLHNEFLRIQNSLRKTIVFVTHFIDEAIQLADRIVVMESGKLVQYETPENILAFPSNKFVRDFIGANKNLKLLLRFFVKDFIRPAHSIHLTENIEKAKAHLGKEDPFWVTNHDGTLLGWMDADRTLHASTVEQALQQADWEELIVKPESTLEEALSKILGLQLKKIAVVDHDHFLLGEVRLSDIRKVAHQGIAP